MDFIIEPQKKLPVCDNADIFVAGGSCTGVFAAVRAARLGAKVVLVERQNCLGGMATSALVNVWHSLKDTDYKNQVIAGLTAEMTERLLKSDSAILDDNPSTAIVFDPNRLKYELDELVKEEKIKVYLHTICADVLCDGNEITAAIIENKDGRSAVCAKYFIDATGDGDLMKRLGASGYKGSPMQPPTPCFFMQGNLDGIDYKEIVIKYGASVGLDDDFGWDSYVPGLDGISMRAEFHILEKDCSTADGLTFVEMEGRRKAYALCDLINKHTDANVKVAALSSLAGIRETNHYDTITKACGWDMLNGVRYDDAILNGTYRIDIHDEDGGVKFYYLDGKTVYMKGIERNYIYGNWRDEKGITSPAAKYYQIPFSVLVQKNYKNIIAAGRMINADKMAFGALRVMVNLNQLGEAAGVASYLALNKGCAIYNLCGKEVHQKLKDGGSAL